ncbi:hypothetical protein OLMES_1290 [Oleiphilus messinensis]|uniref:Uncharacterized protein n=1 Tax=Oleiphilus messinensis TaxID=141451 RepID=A0A1Y0I580_9GAMM|nr:hypothetical protein [Oleiphilus messinensis]ARU55369.1 hypothetical protein OLMES_1290 [Oleiphilus messinensis]
MAQFILSNQALSSHQFPQEYRANGIYSVSGSVSFLSAYQPYSFGPIDSANRQIYNSLSTAPASALQQTTSLYDHYSSDTVLAFAEIMNHIRKIKESQTTKDFSIGAAGAATSVYAERMNGFAKAVLQYEGALMKFANARQSGIAPRMKQGLKANAQRAFENLQQQFSNELRIVTGRVKSNRGTPLSNANRGLNIARSSRSLSNLEIHNQVQAHNLLKFTKHANVLGTGLVAVDFTTRVGNIYNEYQANGNWERELFVQSASFAASTMTGVALANIGTTAVGFLLALTPVGWVGLIVGGVAVVAGTAAASVWVNNLISSNSGDWYDQIMNWLAF